MYCILKASWPGWLYKKNMCQKCVRRTHKMHLVCERRHINSNVPFEIYEFVWARAGLTMLCEHQNNGGNKCESLKSCDVYDYKTKSFFDLSIKQVFVCCEGLGSQRIQMIFLISNACQANGRKKINRLWPSFRSITLVDYDGVDDDDDNDALQSFKWNCLKWQTDSPFYPLFDAFGKLNVRSWNAPYNNNASDIKW